ncbi:lipopolysaccharide biosynthesis protein [Bradyrhizobium sp. WBOS7]|uniref:Lipopolysaccharide biosynthesis protein n=1 Tax=Bradyrhizobium betae TaxID=244734 RepID=A0AAE9NDZ1_9BRAD|nr:MULTISPECIES: exopolysaccharide transport family protein [Bradyrhizobium]MDD1574587.1 lipopolysaccharide biosynthesis protein [Bradyrhizobium sp. WBOS1]UUO37457.1 lipopolysaccharide biosynthesis protein [Bradyrhizobium sp. WBOS01]MDD1531186.1 lipopolysaccharide biosynthesis protein [Bradyrhizobium sp. WBOS2]MDD1580696.1 lipopolysaccharide biosynthesis protein [Bradyrhizobium sp. WBOS7]MDD1603987.1 lipopolysaccharide biosynthesis protein [Bradyrhizobium sp. WBOS16]
MRLAFWRAGKDKAVVARAVSKPKADVAPKSEKTDKAEKAEVKAEPRIEAAPAPIVTKQAQVESGDIDLHALGAALARKRGWIVVPTVLALVASIAAVSLVTPRYKSESRILIDGRENVFLRPNSDRTEERQALDPEAVTSQVQLVLSRDLAREIIKKNKLAERPEFDPVLQGISPLKSLAALIGIVRDPFAMTPEERVLDAYYERLQAYAVDKSRVIVVEFQSADPELAARVANSIAEGYLVLQQAVRQDQAKNASQWLAGEIENLRKKVSEAEARVEDFRSKSSLFIGTNNTTLSNQQMGEVNTQLNNARSMKADAESKARLIKEMLQSGKPIEASEVLNSELVRRLSEQRVTLRAQLAEQSSTLLGNHPRIKELKAQLGDLDNQIRDEAGKISRSLENDARIAGGRVDGLIVSLEQLKKQAASTNGQDVQLRALEREAKAQRDLLETYLAKYREANTRETIDTAPTDGRIISRAIVSNTPAYPKKLPIVLIATIATLLLSSGVVVTGELLRQTAPRAVAAVFPAQAPVRQAPVVRPAVEPAFDPGIEPAVAEPTPLQPEMAADSDVTEFTEFTEIERLAEDLRAAGAAAKKVTVLGTAPGESITLSTLTLARHLAREARVVVVDLAASSPTIAAVSVDASAPGLAELMQGEASFAQVITRDKLSRLHLVMAGRPGFDRSLLQSPRVTLAIDALLRAYDHVLIDAGSASDLPAELLTAHARAVVVPDASMASDARTLMCEQLKAVGFNEVTMLTKPVQPSNAAEAPRVVAA